MRRICFLLIWSAALALAQDGAAVYQAHCGSCHDAPTGRIPPVSALKAMSFPVILGTLETGSMKTQGAGLSSAERYAVVVYLSTAPPKPATVPQSAFCSGTTAPFRDSPGGASWNGWSSDATNTRFQDARAAGISVNDVPKLKLKWAFGLGDGIVARSQPAVAGGRLFLGTSSGTVYSLDANSGCIYWTAQAEGGIRSALVYGPASGPAKQPVIYFGSGRYSYAIEAATGKPIWKVAVDDHFMAGVTAAPQLHRGVLYVSVSSAEEVVAPSPSYECCTFRGSVVAVDAATGKVLWKTYTIAEAPKPTKKSKTGAQLHGPSGAAVWSTPTFDEKRNAVYVATGDNYSDPPSETSDAVIAMDAKTGKTLWSRQLTPNDTYNVGCEIPGKVNCPDTSGPDLDFGQPPILVTLSSGRRALVIGQKSGMAHALDPDKQGAVLWQTRVGKGGPLGGMQWGSAADRERMYAAISDYVVRTPDPSAPTGFKSDMSQAGGLFALKLATGEKVWSATPSACGDRKGCRSSHSQAVTVIAGAVFAGSMDGHLRAFSTSTGEVLWDVDTLGEHPTVNGSTAKGGSLDGPGPVIAGGMLYVNSGYGQFGGMPGNAFLAFSVDGR